MDLSSYYDWVWGDKPYGQRQVHRPGTLPTVAHLHGVNANCAKHGHHLSWCTTPDACAGKDLPTRVESGRELLRGEQ